MKKWFLLALLLAPLAAAAQFVPHAPAKAAYCLNPSGVWVPIATSQTASQLPNSPPASDLYGINGSTWFGLNCDSGGNLGVTSFAAPSGSWPSWLVPTVTNSTTTPSLAVAAGNVNANQVMAGPASGAAAPLAPRSLVSADIPANAASFRAPMTGWIGLCVPTNDTTFSTFNCLGTGLAVAASSTSANNSPSLSAPMFARSTGTAASGDSAGYIENGNPVTPFYAGHQPSLTFQIAYASSTDYTQQGRIQLGFLGSSCSIATFISSATDKPACTYAIIRYSTVASDTSYQCVTDNGSGSPTVTSLGVAPNATYALMNISINASSVSCTVGSTTVTNSATLPASTTLMSDVYLNTSETASTAAHLWLGQTYSFNQATSF
jgi:hypothetical protein